MTTASDKPGSGRAYSILALKLNGFWSKRDGVEVTSSSRESFPKRLLRAIWQEAGSLLSPTENSREPSGAFAEAFPTIVATSIPSLGLTRETILSLLCMVECLCAEFVPNVSIDLFCTLVVLIPPFSLVLTRRDPKGICS